MKKRYVVTATYFVYADSDERAKEIVNDIKKKERDLFDNSYEIECLEENKFASLERRKITI